METQGTVLSMSDLFDIDQAHGAADSGLVKGDRIGDATLDEPIARMTSATVWRARSDAGYRAVVALDRDASTEDRVAFAACAQILARVAQESPIAGLLRVDFMTAAGRSWVTACSVVGGLSDIHALGWDVDRKVQLFADLCRSVATLRQRGIRCVPSPTNVLIDDALSPVITEVGATSSASQAYVADGESDDGPSAVYNLGAMLWFLLSGSEPSPERHPCPDLAALFDQPEALVRVARRCLSATPSLRYQDIAELLADLDGAREGMPGGARIDVSEIANGWSRQLATQRARARDVAAISEPSGPRFGRWRLAAGALVVAAVGLAYVIGSAAQPACLGLMMGGLAVMATALPAPRKARIAFALLAVSLTWLADPVAAVAAAGDRRNVASGSAARRVAAFRSQLAHGQRNFSGASFAQADLSSMQLANVTFERADLRGANLSRTQLNGADLIGARLDGANLSGADLTGAALERATGLEGSGCDDLTRFGDGWWCDGGHVRAGAPDNPLDL